MRARALVACVFFIVAIQGCAAEDSGSGNPWSEDDDVFELGRPMTTTAGANATNVSYCELSAHACAASDGCEWVCIDDDPPCRCEKRSDAQTSPPTKTVDVVPGADEVVLDDSTSGMSRGRIVGVVIGCVLVLGAVVWIVVISAKGGLRASFADTEAPYTYNALIKMTEFTEA